MSLPAEGEAMSTDSRRGKEKMPLVLGQKGEPLPQDEISSPLKGEDCSSSCPIYWAAVPDESGNYKIQVRVNGTVCMKQARLGFNETMKDTKDSKSGGVDSGLEI